MKLAGIALAPIAVISVSLFVALGAQAETYRLVEYLESTGVQSVDTGVMPTAGDVITVEALSSVKNKIVIGAQSALAKRTTLGMSNDNAPKVAYRACKDAAANVLSFPLNEQRRLVWTFRRRRRGATGRAPPSQSARPCRPSTTGSSPRMSTASARLR